MNIILEILQNNQIKISMTLKRPCHKLLMPSNYILCRFHRRSGSCRLPPGRSHASAKTLSVAIKSAHGSDNPCILLTWSWEAHDSMTLALSNLVIKTSLGKHGSFFIYIYALAMHLPKKHFLGSRILVIQNNWRIWIEKILANVF